MDYVAHNTEGRCVPLVLVHTWYTDAEGTEALAAFLGRDQPIYGIDHPDPDVDHLPTTVDEWVVQVRAVLDRLALPPPFLLGGFSFGGVIALELTRQLAAEGTHVPWLGLIDSARPRLNPRGARAYVRYHLQVLLDMTDPAVRRRYVVRRVGGGVRRTGRRVGRRALVTLHLRDASSLTSVEDLSMPPLKRAVWRSYLSYVATSYDAPVALFSTEESRAPVHGDPSLGWSKYFRGGFEAHEIDGGHKEIFLPEHIESVGCAVRRSLSTAMPERPVARG